MKRKDSSNRILGELRERLTHNRAYLEQSRGTRAYASRLSYGVEKSDEWLLGQKEAIREENEWIERLLEDLE